MAVMPLLSPNSSAEVLSSSGLKLFTSRQCRVTSEVYLHFIRRNNAEQNGAKMTRLDSAVYMAVNTLQDSNVGPDNDQTLHQWWGRQEGSFIRCFCATLPLQTLISQGTSPYSAITSVAPCRSCVTQGCTEQGGVFVVQPVFFDLLYFSSWRRLLKSHHLAVVLANSPSFFGIQRNKTRLILSQYICNKNVTL